MITLSIICTSITIGMIMNLIIREKPESSSAVVDEFQEAEQIIIEVSKATGISVEKMKSKTRLRQVVIPRQIAQYLIYKQLKGRLSVFEIGAIFNRNHATIIHSCNEVVKKIETNDNLVCPIIEKLELNSAI